MHRCPAAEDRLDDGPRRFDAVLAREERRVAGHGIAEQPLVGVHVVAAGLVDDLELGRLGAHLLAGPLDPRADGDRHVGAQPEAHVVGLVRTQLAQRRPLERDEHLGSRGGRHLPARMKKGTPSQRQESMWSRTAAKVSTAESGATPSSSR